jgi:hypothetical protein
MARAARLPSLEFRLHLILGMAAYSLFTIAMLHALLMALAERSLAQSEQAAAVRRPAERPAGRPAAAADAGALLFRIIAPAFVLLTLTLADRARCSPESLFGRALRFDHKTLFALLSWLIFAGLLLGRCAYRAGAAAWRCAARWPASSTLLLAYVGSRFVLEVVLQPAPERATRPAPRGRHSLRLAVRRARRCCWCCRAFFSIAETSMMALNRYRLRAPRRAGPRRRAARLADLLGADPPAARRDPARQQVSSTRPRPRWCR